jgi:cytosine/adenosine deaminase-related metal-dependent hydrolase
MEQSAFCPPRELVEDALALAQERTPPPEDLLKMITRAAASAANLELEIQDKSDLLAELRARHRRLLHEELPALMEQARMRDFTLKGSGNLPDKKFEIRAKYHANVPVTWDEERRERAFKVLRENDGSHLIRTTVMVHFPHGQDDEAKSFCDSLARGDFDFEVKRSVSHGSMSKWLRLRVEEGRPIPQLDLIDGVVGSNAVIKDA